MKKTIILIAVAAALFLTGCEITDVDIPGRIAAFETDLNSSDRTGIWNNFSSTATSEYENLQDTSYWDTGSIWSLANRDFTLSINSISNDNADVTVNNSLGDIHMRFEMVAEKNGLTTTWYIDNIYNYGISDYEIRGITQ
ncbi:MAG: hypothetical protein JXB03_09590 [Spirochaetales bacterium]|nr:hypothetical protein [Spirochaetales bacterium]